MPNKKIPGFREHCIDEKKKQYQELAAKLKHTQQQKKELLRFLARVPWKCQEKGQAVFALLMILGWLMVVAFMIVSVMQGELNNGFFYAAGVGLGASVMVPVWRAIMNSQVACSLYGKFLYKNSMKLTQWGLSERELKRIYDKAPHVIYGVARHTPQLFENLMHGGLDNANYDTIVSIIGGHLSKHPEDYEHLIRVFDKKSLPRDIVEKYGKNGRVR